MLDAADVKDLLGRVEYVIESRRRNALERRFVVRPDTKVVPRVDTELPPASSPAGYNPYFDLPAV